MVNLVGEVLERAKRDIFLLRVLGIAIGDRLIGKDNLHIALGTERAAFEQRLPVPNALAVSVQPSLYVIDGVYNDV